MLDAYLPQTETDSSTFGTQVTVSISFNISTDQFSGNFSFFIFYLSIYLSIYLLDVDKESI